MEDSTPDYKKRGFDSQQEALKYMLASLLKNRKKILDCGLGSAWTTGQNKHEAIPELAEAVFIIGGQMFFLRERGFVKESELRV
jgi:hypothetical protein